MLALLQDPIWQFVGAFLALVAIGVTVWIYFAQRTRRRLLVEKVGRMPLVTIGPKKIPGLAITVNDQPITQAIVVLVRITNIGNTPLVTSDFEVPITLEFEGDARVLHAEVSESIPPNLPIGVTQVANTVQFERQLLNSGDSFACRILIQNSIGIYRTRGRVVGVNAIETTPRAPVGAPIAIVLGLLVFATSMIFAPKTQTVALVLTKEQLPYMVTAISGALVAVAFSVSDLFSKLKRIRESILWFRTEKQ